MPRAIKNITGQVFGRLTALSFDVERSTKKNKFWLCVCSCGNQKSVSSGHLISGYVSSCSCLQIERKAARRTLRGQSQTPEAMVWRQMITRCSNSKAQNFGYYGGRGIKVCDRWRGDFFAFLADMGPRPTREHTIDRIDNDGHYEPGNCRWATMLEQSKNKRPRRTQMEVSR